MNAILKWFCEKQLTLIQICIQNFDSIFIFIPLKKHKPTKCSVFERMFFSLSEQRLYDTMEILKKLLCLSLIFVFSCENVFLFFSNSSHHRRYSRMG